MQDSYLAERVPSVVFVLVLCSSILHLVVVSFMLVKFIFVNHIHIITKVRHSYPICSHYDGSCTASSARSTAMETHRLPFNLSAVIRLLARTIQCSLLLFAKMPRLTNLKRRKLKPSIPSQHPSPASIPTSSSLCQPYAKQPLNVASKCTSERQSSQNLSSYLITTTRSMAMM